MSFEEGGTRLDVARGFDGVLVVAFVVGSFVGMNVWGESASTLKVPRVPSLVASRRTLSALSSPMSSSKITWKSTSTLPGLFPWETMQLHLQSKRR